VGAPAITEDHVFVTTTRSPSGDLSLAAISLAEEIRCPFVTRGRRPLKGLIGDPERVDHPIVVAEHEIRFEFGGEVHRFHPNMARPRIRSLVKGDKDRMVEAAGLRSGDSFLDCTCGLGSDAMVVAHVVGREGRVSAIEQSKVLASIVRYGMRTYAHPAVDVVHAMRRVAVVCTDSAHLLQTLDDWSWDVVYFDPMFESTLSHSQGLSLVRLLAYSGVPTEETLGEAARVARRAVVVKDRVSGSLIEELGLSVISDSGRVRYGRLNV